MPVLAAEAHGRPGFRYSGVGTIHTYDPGRPRQRAVAYALAVQQGRAIEAAQAPRVEPRQDTPRRRPRPGFPVRLEARYRERLLARNRLAEDLTARALAPWFAKRTQREAQAARAAREDGRRLDAPPPADGSSPPLPLPYSPAELAEFVKILVTVEDVIASDHAPDEDELRAIARDLDIFASRQTVEQIQRVANIDVWALPGLTGEYERWLKENVELITSIDSKRFDQVRDLVDEALRSGRATEDVQRIIQQRFSVSASRARLIARDQIGTLNAKITQKRQTDLGIEKYQWSSSGDERVRRRHEGLDGTIQRWDAPPKSGVRGEHQHPGEPIACRCDALAVIDDEDEAELVRASAERQVREAEILAQSPITRGEIVPIARRRVDPERLWELAEGRSPSGIRAANTLRGPKRGNQKAVAPGAASTRVAPTVPSLPPDPTLQPRGPKKAPLATSAEQRRTFDGEDRTSGVLARAGYDPEQIPEAKFSPDLRMGGHAWDVYTPTGGRQTVVREVRRKVRERKPRVVINLDDHPNPGEVVRYLEFQRDTAGLQGVDELLIVRGEEIQRLI